VVREGKGPQSGCVYWEGPGDSDRGVIGVAAAACGAVALGNEDLVVVDEGRHLEGAAVRSNDDVTLVSRLEVDVVGLLWPLLLQGHAIWQKDLRAA
jgi:hypothetical protein